MRKRGFHTPAEVTEARRDAIFKAMLDSYYLEANKGYNASQLCKRATEYCSYGRISPQNVSRILEDFVQQGIITIRATVAKTQYRNLTFEYSINDANKDNVHIVAEYVTGRDLRAA